MQDNPCKVEERLALNQRMQPVIILWPVVGNIVEERLALNQRMQLGIHGDVCMVGLSLKSDLR